MGIEGGAEGGEHSQDRRQVCSALLKSHSFTYELIVFWFWFAPP